MPTAEDWAVELPPPARRYLMPPLPFLEAGQGPTAHAAASQVAAAAAPTDISASAGASGSVATAASETVVVGVEEGASADRRHPVDGARAAVVDALSAPPLAPAAVTFLAFASQELELRTPPPHWPAVQVSRWLAMAWRRLGDDGRRPTPRD